MYMSSEVKVTILDRIEYGEREDLVVPSEEEMLSSSSTTQLISLIYHP